MRKNHLLLFLFFFGVSSLFAQSRLEIAVDFRVGSSVIEQQYSNNSGKLSDIVSSLEKIISDESQELVSVSFCGAASPEGSFQLNKKLSNARLSALEKYVGARVAIPADTRILHDDQYIQWDYLIELVEQSDISHKQEVLQILRAESHVTEYDDGRRVDSRIDQLKELDNGRVWRTLLDRFFVGMRNASIVIVTQEKEIPVVVEVVEEPVEVIEEVEEIAVPEEVPEGVAVEYIEEEEETVHIPAREWTQQLYVKSNAVGLAMLIANVHVEMDLSPHWSATLPVYYSAWDYFRHDLKFRTFKVQPEVRYWLKDNDGFFAGAHLTMAYYNVAWKKDYRIQDKNRNTPAFGGGLSVGYRLPVSKDNRWKMEFALGAGGYNIHYNKFHNTRNGYMVDTVKDTYWGIDQIAVTVAYMFDVKTVLR